MSEFEFKTENSQKIILTTFLKKHAKIIVPALIASIIILLFTKFLVLAFLLFVHAIMCASLGALKRNHIGVQLVTFITVLSGVAYGAKTGAIIGMFAMAADYIFSARLSYFSIITIPTYALIGILAGSLQNADLFMLGILLTAFYNLFTWIFILGFMGGHIEKCIRFAATDLAFNALLFGSIAPILIRIMS